MACVLIPTAEAVITTVVTAVLEKKAKKSGKTENVGKTPFYKKMKVLNSMLWGGSALLIFEHVWHGEIVPYFPFLTAAQNPQDTAVMLHEMSTVGVAMAVLVTLIWGIGVAVYSAMERKQSSIKEITK